MNKSKIKIGIIGCGVIGSEIAAYCDKKLSHACRIIFLNDFDEPKARMLSKRLKSKPRIVSSDELIEKSDFIIEAASPDVSCLIAEKTLRKDKSALIMSVGGLLKVKNLDNLLNSTKGNIYIPSGAVCGIDGALGAKIGGITGVTLITRKPLKGLKGAPYFTERKINIERIKKETLVFSGSAKQATKYFPKNINVSATLSLAGVGPEKTKVKIIRSMCVI